MLLPKPTESNFKFIQRLLSRSQSSLPLDDDRHWHSPEEQSRTPLAQMKKRTSAALTACLTTLPLPANGGGPKRDARTEAGPSGRPWIATAQVRRPQRTSSRPLSSIATCPRRSPAGSDSSAGSQIGRLCTTVVSVTLPVSLTSPSSGSRKNTVGRGAGRPQAADASLGIVDGASWSTDTSPWYSEPEGKKSGSDSRKV
jgi:hypothetical protein